MSSETQIDQRNLNLTTPHAAAVAGIISGVLFIAVHLLLRSTISITLTGAEPLTVEKAGRLALYLSLVPFAGIAFLWFIGVARDRLGRREDQFFSTVFIGSGLLYLALTFIASGIAGGLLMSFPSFEPALGASITKLTLATIRQIVLVYCIRMAAVFMISSATLWNRTKVMPRWLVLLTYLMGLGLLLLINISLWIQLVFPIWMLTVSIIILIINYRRPSQSWTEPLPVNP